MRSLVDTSWVHWVPPAIFSGMALALVLLGVYLAVWATVEASYLRIPASVLAILSVAFAGALAYETAAIVTKAFPTISVVTRAAFERDTITWVAAFGAVMLIAGLLGTVFTRVAQAMRARLRGTAAAILPAAVLAAGLVAASLAVTRLPMPLAAPSPGGPEFSWWVLYAGGTLFGFGALVAWGFDLQPGAPSARIAEWALTRAAMSVVGSRPVSAVLFTFTAVALMAFALFIIAWGVVKGGYLAPLDYVLAAISVSAAIAVGYQDVVVLRGRGRSIADIADSAFTGRPVVWASAFSALLFGFGLLATHFTRKAGPTTTVVTAAHALTAALPAVAWAALFGAGLVAGAVLVSRLTPRIAGGRPGYAAISWWVVYTGGTAYALGALLAWATNWAP